MTFDKDSEDPPQGIEVPLFSDRATALSKPENAIVLPALMRQRTCGGRHGPTANTVTGHVDSRLRWLCMNDVFRQDLLRWGPDGGPCSMGGPS